VKAVKKYPEFLFSEYILFIFLRKNVLLIEKKSVEYKHNACKNIKTIKSFLGG